MAAGGKIHGNARGNDCPCSCRWELIHPREARGALRFAAATKFSIPAGIRFSQNRGAMRASPNAIKISATAMFINIFGHFRNGEGGLRACTPRI